MTYNAHGCVGLDARLDPERIARVIEKLRPDVVALQELYVGHRRSRGMDQPAWLARRLAMSFEFGVAHESGGGRYGNAILSRGAIRVVRAECLPRFAPHLEPRAALRVGIETPFGELDVVNTHLGLKPHERMLQTDALVGDWLSHLEPLSLAVLCGDLNAVPASPVYQSIVQKLADVQCADGQKPAKTWPAFWPLLRIDHIFVSAGLAVVDCRVAIFPLARVASDHLPLVVDLIAAETRA